MTAVEGMGDAPAHPGLAQMLEHYILRATDVQKYRQVEFACQLELRGKVEFLLLAVMIVHEEIQPDLAYGNGFGQRQIFAQHLEIGRHGMCHIHGMNAKCG